MKFSTALSLIPALALVAAGAGASAQEFTAPTPADSAAVQAAAKSLKYEDYSVKAYTLTFFYGSFNGARYLDLPEVGPKTVVTPGVGDLMGPADVLGYNGLPLPEARQRFADGTLKYDAAQKEIDPGPAIGARIGVYVSDNFHLDLLGTYAQGTAVTTMLRKDQYDPSLNTRVQLDEDQGFTVYKGGVAMMYDALPAKFWGLVPRLGFGLGGIINRFSELEDKTSLYLEGNLGLTHRFGDRLDLILQADLTTFAFEVDELGYGNMVKYSTLSLGLSWFIDVLPPDVRARHLAATGE